MEEHRKSPRHRALKGGRIVFHNGSSTLSCVVHDLSKDGARLEIASVLGVPKEFDLVFDDGSPTRRCVVLRKEETVLGVEFRQA